MMNQTARKKSKTLTLRRSVAILKKQMPELAKRYRVKSLGVFGSYVRNQQSRRSDLDILVDFTQTPNLFEFMDLEEHLERALNVKVDLVSRHALKGEIGKRILSEVVTIWNIPCQDSRVEGARGEGGEEITQGSRGAGESVYPCSLWFDSN